MSSQIGEPIVINLEEARKRLKREPAGTKVLSDGSGVFKVSGALVIKTIQ